jgi:hypothetical protein
MSGRARGNFTAGRTGGGFVANNNRGRVVGPANSGRYAGNWTHNNGRHWNGRWQHRRHGGFFPGFAAGVAIGSGWGYGGYPYGYYDDYAYDDGYAYGAYAAAPEYSNASVQYCMQRFRSYDLATRTYLGYDGERHPCP